MPDSRFSTKAEAALAAIDLVRTALESDGGKTERKETLLKLVREFDPDPLNTFGALKCLGEMIEMIELAAAIELVLPEAPSDASAT